MKKIWWTHEEDGVARWMSGEVYAVKVTDEDGCDIYFELDGRDGEFLWEEPQTPLEQDKQCQHIYCKDVCTAPESQRNNPEYEPLSSDPSSDWAKARWK